MCIYFVLIYNEELKAQFMDCLPDRTEQTEESAKIVDIKFPRSSSKRRSITQAEQQGQVKSTARMHLPF